MPLNHPEVEFVLQAAQALAVGVNDGDVVVFPDQVFRQRAADLSGAQNDNFHQLRPVISLLFD